MNKKYWNCPICEFKTTEKKLRDQHVHKEFDRKYDELERLSEETTKDNIEEKADELYGNNPNNLGNSGSFISGYKNIVNLYKSI